jgi:glucoamylase
MSNNEKNAPGGPGIEPRWTTSAKSGVGASLDSASRVWFSLSHGIVNEIYYPRVDQACIRDMGLIITDGKNFFSEEKRDTRNEIETLEDGVPAYLMNNICNDGRYRIEKEVLTDPYRDTFLQQIRFYPLKGAIKNYHVYVLLAPHLGNRGMGNTAWLGDYKGHKMLFAERDGISLALACSQPWLKRSVGYVGTSDGWQDLDTNKQMTWEYERAENGNVALTGEIELPDAGEPFLLALGFGLNPAEAGHRALASLLDGYDHARKEYIRQWQDWQKHCKSLESVSPSKKELYRTSAMVMRVHEAKRFPGGTIASLSIPWGSTKGDDDLGGYHLVWPRDQVETAGGLLAAGAKEDALRVIYYLEYTQEEDGHWPQNMWLDGNPYWGGIQMDETAFPILLVDLAVREGLLDDVKEARLWPMVKRAAGFLVSNGPVSPQDRWEEDPGYSPFTLAAEIAALLAAATLAERAKEPELAEYLRQTADAWNESIERWTYASDTDLAKKMGVEGYYVRISPPQVAEASSPTQGYVPIKNRPPGDSEEEAYEIVSPDALALVRFGLRDPEDPRILNTIKVIDKMLKVNTPFGPAWHRYNDDGYGEHEDGSGFDGTGIGRAWPLLTAERAHYELAKGDTKAARRLMEALESFSNQGGMISEQIWDSDDIPEQELYCGKPSGSAMPLVWAHAEYVKLCRSLSDGKVFDMPPQTVERYRKNKQGSAYSLWRFNHKSRTMPSGKILRVELPAPASLHWSTNDWKTTKDTKTKDSGLGLHYVDLDLSKLKEGSKVIFTMHWLEEDRWEGDNYTVEIKSQ